MTKKSKDKRKYLVWKYDVVEDHYDSWSSDTLVATSEVMELYAHDLDESEKTILRQNQYKVVEVLQKEDLQAEIARILEEEKKRKEKAAKRREEAARKRKLKKAQEAKLAEKEEKQLFDELKQKYDK